MEKKWHKQRKRLFEIVEVGYSLDFVSRMYDLLNVLAIVLNLVASILYTFDGSMSSFLFTIAVI